MQEGSLRCDANISLRRKGERGFGVKSEIKNLNSFRAVQRALEYEVKRQRAELEAGATLIPDTRHWDEERGITVQMRTKEEADDYRYFPDPDLMPITIESSWVEGDTGHHSRAAPGPAGAVYPGSTNCRSTMPRS